MRQRYYKPYKQETCELTISPYHPNNTRLSNYKIAGGIDAKFEII